MFEDTRAKKRRFDPLRSQRRNRGKLNCWDRCADQRHMNGMIEAAGRDHRRGAVVLDAIRVGVDTLVQLR